MKVFGCRGRVGVACSGGGDLSSAHFARRRVSMLGIAIYAENAKSAKARIRDKTCLSRLKSYRNMCLICSYTNS